MRITTIVITTSRSTNVKPRRRSRASLAAPPPPRLSTLPLGIRCAIGRFLVRLAVHAEYILAAPAGGLGVVLIAAQAPFGLVREGVARDLAQQPDLLAVGAIGKLDAFDQLVEALRPAVRALLHRTEIRLVAVVLIFVDGRVHLPKSGAELPFPLDTHTSARERHRHAREDQQNGEGDDQLYKRQPSLFLALH